MSIVWSLLVGLLLFLAVGGPILFFHSRKVLREQKNFERGLKMVTLLIHLPPMSEDTEGGSRDAREVVEENISKAQVLYGIISSTLKKGMKSKFYGQRHFAFEIVGVRGLVQFYVAVPMVMVDTVTQAVVSAYQSAQLEEVTDHNIFSTVGKISGSAGGELTLKKSFAYPIATYQEVKRDVIESLLNALSTLGKEDGAAIQILLRPAPDKWRSQAQAVSSSKRKGEKKGSKAVGIGRDVLTAFSKPPEDKKGESKEHELSSLERSIIEAIDDKTRHPGFEALIRIVVSSNISQRAQAILNNIVSGFSLLDAPGKNGFKFTPAKDIEKFVTSYILRFFPPENNKNILNSVELATIFHFPDQKNIPTAQLKRQQSKQVDGPPNLPERGLLLGYNVFRAVKKPIYLDLDDRRRHIYTVGQTGTGKTTFLENLALQDMLDGHGLAFIDPHGDVSERLLSMVPRERTEDVIYFFPGDMDYPMGLNLFEYEQPQQKDFLIQETINMLYKLYDPQHQGIIGPRYEHWFRNAALTVMADPKGGTFIDIPNVFQDSRYMREKLQYVKDPTVLDFWNKEMAQTSDYHKSEVLGWFVSKFGAFRANEMMRNIIGQVDSAFDLREVMDNKKILIVNLSKGRLGELNSKLLGMIFVMKFQAAAMSRATIPEEERQDFALYVDEFQNFSTDSFATIMSEARKYHLNLIVANQHTTQLTDEIRDAVFGNMGTIVAFRVGTNDVEALVKYFSPVFDTEDLLRVPNFNTITRTMIGGVPTQAFSMSTLPPLGTPNKQLAIALKQLSAAKYGRPKAIVESEIFERQKTRPEPAMPPGMAAGPRPGLAATAPGRAASTNGSSFLDEWLAKRRVSTPGAPPPASLGSSVPTQPPQTSPFGQPDHQASYLVNQAPPAPKLHGELKISAPSEPDNLSSVQKDKQDAAKIADELKHTLKPSKSSIPPMPKAPDSDPDDTIIIDNEGNFKPKQEQED